MSTATDHELAERLSAVYLFSELNKRNLHRLVGAGKVVAHPVGHKIVRQGDPPLAFHLLLEGEADVVIDGKVGRTLRPGDFFGEIGVIDRKPRSATVVATSPVQTWLVNSAVFNQFLEDDVSFTHSILLGLCSRLRSPAIPTPRAEQASPAP